LASFRHPSWCAHRFYAPDGFRQVSLAFVPPVPIETGVKRAPGTVL
jgi:hypothetical protein